MKEVTEEEEKLHHGNPSFFMQIVSVCFLTPFAFEAKVSFLSLLLNVECPVSFINSGTVVSTVTSQHPGQGLSVWSLFILVLFYCLLFLFCFTII